MSDKKDKDKKKGKIINFVNRSKQNKKIPHFLITIRRGITRFLKCFVSRKGYREGKWGFIIALMASLYIVLSYLKATEIREKK